MNKRNPDGTYQKIDELYVVIAIDSNGNEGIMAFGTDLGLHPMVTAEWKSIEKFKSIADEIGVKYEVRHYRRETIQ